MPRLPIEGLVERRPYRRLKLVLVLLALAGIAFGIFVATRPNVAEKKTPDRGSQNAAVKQTGAKSSRGAEQSDRVDESGAFASWKGPARASGAGIRPSPYSAGIWKKIEALDPQLRKWRRELHRHPEPANRENWTSHYLAGILGSLKVRVRKIPESTGLVAAIEGGPGPVVALVAGMDGLPVREATKRPYASTSQVTFRGKKVWMSHAGGRDVEMAVLLGVASVLSSMDDQLPGTVLLIFQPASEQTPAGEQAGAQVLIDSGALSRPPVEALFWMSVKPRVRIGRLLAPEGRWWRGMTRIRIQVAGRASSACAKTAGGCADPVLAASQLLVNIRAQMARQVTRSDRVRLTIHKVRAEGKEGLNAGRVVIEGVLRWRDAASRRQVLLLVDRVAKGLRVSSGVSVQVASRTLGRFVPSDPGLARWAMPTLRRALGPGGVITAPLGPPGVGFNRYRRLVPAVALGLGTHSSKLGRIRHLGSSDFDVDEECLSVGVHVLANLALDYLLDRRKRSGSRPGAAIPSRAPRRPGQAGRRPPSSRAGARP